MSESENVALVREGIEAFNRGDIDWLLERIDEDFASTGAAAAAR